MEKKPRSSLNVMDFHKNTTRNKSQRLTRNRIKYFKTVFKDLDFKCVVTLLRAAMAF